MSSACPTAHLNLRRLQRDFVNKHSKMLLCLIVVLVGLISLDQVYLAQQSNLFGADSGIKDHMHIPVGQSVHNEHSVSHHKKNTLQNLEHTQLPDSPPVEIRCPRPEFGCGCEGCQRFFMAHFLTLPQICYHCSINKDVRGAPPEQGLRSFYHHLLGPPPTPPPIILT